VTANNIANKPVQESRTISENALLYSVGLMSIALPIVVALISWISAEVSQQESISAYYYTPLRDILMGTLFAIAGFLLFYNGYKHKPGETVSDRTLSLIAAIGLAFVVIFPTSAPANDTSVIPSLAKFFTDGFIQWTHRIGAIAFMTALGIMALVNFRRANFSGKKLAANRLQQQKMEHMIYVVAGVIMLGCVALMISQRLFNGDKMFFDNATFWFEAAGIMAFGVAWLTKTKFLARFYKP